MRLAFRTIILSVVLLFTTIISNYVSAQNVPTPIQCGAIVQSETTPSSPRDRAGWYYQDYSLHLKAGDSITVVNTPLAPTNRTWTYVFDPAYTTIGDSKGSEAGQPIAIQNLIVGASGQYDIRPFTEKVGAYTLTVECHLRDGTPILPGQSDNTQHTQFVETPIESVPVFGFPGLPPVDFTPAIKIPLVPATAMTGAITLAGGEVMGFTLDAAANDKLDLAINRVSGNLNLGVVVLSSENQVVFYGGLITSESLSTRLTLPSAGQYTIGVFRVDLLPPAAPEATAFQVTGTLNPS